MESAAARLRPFLLQQESVHYSKALNAIKYFLKGREFPNADHMVEVLTEAWKETRESETARAYRIESDDGIESISDMKLGYAWIYGDVVHADPIRIADTEAHGVEERFLAAVPLVAHLIITTLATLNFITALVGRGVITLPGNPYTTPVHVSKTEVTYDVKVQMSTTNPDLVSVAEADQRWEPLTSDWLAEVFHGEQQGE
ncbi:hypothetical protein [Rhodococcus aetherivorans]